MVRVRFGLTTNDPWSVDDAICEGISPSGYWQKVNQSPTQTKPYNIYKQVGDSSGCYQGQQDDFTRTMRPLTVLCTDTI